MNYWTATDGCAVGFAEAAHGMTIRYKVKRRKRAK